MGVVNLTIREAVEDDVEVEGAADVPVSRRASIAVRLASIVKRRVLVSTAGGS